MAQSRIDQQISTEIEAFQELGLEKNSRKGFVRKVFLILAVQLTLTASFVVANQTSEPFRKFQQENNSLTLLSLLIGAAISLCLFFKESLTSKVPCNYCLLAILTICLAYFISVFSITNDPTPTRVLKAAFLTAISIVFSFAYAMKDQEDASKMINLSFIILLVTIIKCLWNYFIYAEIILYVEVVFLLCAYLIDDFQQVFRIERCKLELDNYILGSLKIYTVIIILFGIFILIDAILIILMFNISLL